MVEDILERIVSNVPQPQAVEVSVSSLAQRDLSLVSCAPHSLLSRSSLTERCTNTTFALPRRSRCSTSSPYCSPSLRSTLTSSLPSSAARSSRYQHTAHTLITSLYHTLRRGSVPPRRGFARRLSSVQASCAGTASSPGSPHSTRPSSASSRCTVQGDLGFTHAHNTHFVSNKCPFEGKKYIFVVAVSPLAIAVSHGPWRTRRYAQRRHGVAAQRSN